MYLYRKTHTYSWGDKEKWEVKVEHNGKPYKAIKPEKIIGVVEEVGYWRKANAIHRWFIENCAGGDEDCRQMYVSRDDLLTLRETVSAVLAKSVLVDGQLHVGTLFKEGKVEEQYEEGKVIKDPSEAKRLLPTQEGFFFGSTDYDEFYIQDLKDTIKIIDEALATTDESVLNQDFSYEASW